MKTLLTNSQIDDVCRHVLHEISKFSELHFSLFNTMYLTGVRFNDLKNFSYFLVDGQYFFTCEMSKNSNKIIFSYHELDPSFANSVIKSNSLAFLSSYRNSLRYFDIVVPGSRLYAGKKNISTHIFRHNKAKKMFDTGSSVVEIQTALGHSSSDNSLRYIHSKIYLEQFPVFESNLSP